ncbi:hypothetical protein A6S26_05540 [Nostoc sp. ATCC 43529]|nr:hypothetical protein A6S26_05540 [Nostoc sp. ATCC 43529]
MTPEQAKSILEEALEKITEVFENKRELKHNYKKGRGQEAEGRRKGVLIKTLVLGLKPSLKKRIVSRRVARDTKRHCFNPTFLNVGSLLPSAFVLLPSEENFGNSLETAMTLIEGCIEDLSDDNEE